MKRCYDEKRGVWMLNDGYGWKPENGKPLRKSHLSPVVSKKTDLRTGQSRLLARLSITRHAISQLFDEQMVNDVFAREECTAQKNRRYLL